MEPAKIDWKTIESVFVIDDMYENIKAPKWADLSAPSLDKSLVDDEAWFCRPDCNHPKTVEDLLQLNVGSKVQRSASLSETLPMGDQNRRDANLKRRPGIARPLLLSKKGTNSEKIVVEGGENVNPNLYSTPSHQYNKMKSVIESSTEKKKNTNNKKKETDKVPQQQLKKTLSARNLFGGRDIVNQITEFCNELKRLATRTKEREPLLEKKGEKCGEELDKSNVMEEEEEIRVRDKKTVEDTENTPPNSFSLDLIEKTKNKNKEAAAVKIQICPPSPAAKIQTCPPSPQCFAAGQSPTATRTPPLKPASRSRLKGRGILQELDQKNKELSEEVSVDRNNNTNNEQGKAAAPIVLDREAPPTLDVFWFLKPCTRLSS